VYSMNKKNLLLVALVAISGVTIFDSIVSNQGAIFAAKKGKKQKSQQGGQQRRKGQKRGKVSEARQEAMAAPLLNPAGRVSTLKADNSYTIGFILSEIRRNSPNSHFILGATNKGATVIQGDPVAAGIDGSISALRAGLAGTVEENSNMMVTLKADPALINLLHNQNRLDTGSKNAYQQILLYFDFGGHRYYVNDPYPAKIVVGRVNPAAQIIGRW